MDDINKENENTVDNLGQKSNKEPSESQYCKIHNFFLNLKHRQLIDQAKWGDSQARQILAEGYLKGEYGFEQDIDKFNELCEIGWNEALEIKKNANM